MNERYQELVRLAVEDAAKYSKRRFDITIEENETFALCFTELIVRECITVIENKMPDFTCKEEYDNLIRKAGRLDAIDEIKEHFGIEP
jgi:hypothetical protein